MAAEKDTGSSLPEHMRGWRFTAPGPVEQSFKLLEDIPTPAKNLNNGEILIRVAWTSINPADYKVPEMGFMARAMLSFPTTAGMDLSGHVLSVAADVSDIDVGDAVFARINPFRREGALSEYVVVPREGYAKLPVGCPLDKAAGAPTVALTAYQCIAPYVKAGDQVFINGGSGGTGTFGIQIAKALGCYVITSCSTGKIELCQKLGADEIIDYKTEDVLQKLTEKGPVLSLVVDNVGDHPADLYTSSDKFLLPEGTFALIAGSPTNIFKGALLPRFLGGGNRKFVFVLTKDNHEQLSIISDWMGSGEVETIIDSTYEFEEALDAFKHLKEGSSAGKVVIAVTDD
ncbi:hypothetical protein G7Z17_g3463 [Cylindrodendrum hubeiense]|uniref:Enoyl reductase (ER) domain-containing protein n=1 Tax=Cylindrodendrum hubeiense TaxID=595255 RepID=A0A9P5LJZ7_9HYPO|nr:hypothetical protein G7Z17_g3463 [Cylindrodendrum hubeiense]